MPAGGVVRLAMSERDLRAGARVLRSLLHSDRPQVQLAVTLALGDRGKHEALGCVARMEAALLAPQDASRWERIVSAVQAWARRWFRNNVADEFPGPGAL